MIAPITMEHYMLLAFEKQGDGKNKLTESADHLYSFI